MSDIRDSLLIGGEWQPGAGEDLVSESPSDGSAVWQGLSADGGQVRAAFRAARHGLAEWWDRPVEERIAVCEAYATLVRARSEELARLIGREIGKPLWDARTEAAAVVGKVALAIEALRQRRDTTSFAMGEATAVTRYKPFGVLAVLGPFNFPAHLPNGHIVPALLAGNAVVFKPSEFSPATGAWMVERWTEAGLPAGVLNLVQGGRAVGEAMAADPDSDGLLFTGSAGAGQALHRLFAQWPQKMLALEMGGNNPLVVYQAGDLRAAAYHAVLSAFLSAGQRCTCARRLIVVEQDSDPDGLLRELTGLAGKLRVGYWDDDPQPFYGTVIHRAAGERVLEAARGLAERGGRMLLQPQLQRGNPALLSPGIVDVTPLKERDDEEVFGPLLSVIRVPDLDAAIREANQTRFGLSAGLLCDDRSAWERFVREIRAGVVNWNRQTTGASGRLPFGGCGLSGNNRPAGYFSADYCSWPVASIEYAALQIPEQVEPGIVL